MSNFQYLDYKGVNRRLDDLVNNPNNKILVKKEYPLGFTDFNLPIEHYSMGSGSKHIIVTGSYHAAEIITTIFVVHLMEDLAKNGGIDFSEYTIDFIPIVNPEGYLITTSMQNLYLDKVKTEDEKIALARKYFQKYRSDAAESIKANKIISNSEATAEEKKEALKVLRGKKQYQALFDDVDMEAFLNVYPELKESVMNIIKSNGYPIGVAAAWTSNGHGVDLSQNVPFNVNLEKYRNSSEALYSGLAYSNIRKDRPSPINAICRDLDNFAFEKENLHMMNFLANLNARKNCEIAGFVNYHSVMGKIYQRPVHDEGMIKLLNIDYDSKLIENYVGARLFREESAYDIIESEDPYSYINEYFRLRYGVNIQIELSRMGSNPIGPLADNDTFMNVTINPNIEAFKNFVNNLDFIKEYTNIINQLVGLYIKRNGNLETTNNPKQFYRFIDYICQTNPSLYTKLRAELCNLSSCNYHVVSYLFDLLDKSLELGLEEASEVKDVLANKNYTNDDFVSNYAKFIRYLMKKVNENRRINKKENLTEEEIELLVDNICRDYPEIFARLKWTLNDSNPDLELISELYKRLELLLKNQEKMGNLIVK